ncbi:ANTAR domain-containing response regulator [Pseudomonas typographi]|uniref:ANTAR domain-containing protein n=1 Tax=Pseudomonas typographi TaxID=2715964 RepID=A0ABR7Z2Y3_9PSED|nr:ANTAR domain-containing protein [Pseudomonas typographi]MBD1599848.1 ANTAR domain-containing protein [Pseudomonas typographi]
MTLRILHDLRGLKVLVIHPFDEAGLSLTDHLRRIGCMVFPVWPVPTELPHPAEIVFLTIDNEFRPDIEQLLKSFRDPKPMVLAMISYENPTTLQMVLESGAIGIVERPVKPFGLLGHLALARHIWLEQQVQAKEITKLRRKMAGERRLAKAKTILMAAKRLTEEQAHQYIRQQAMAKRQAIEEVANMIIQAEDLLRS